MNFEIGYGWASLSQWDTPPADDTIEPTQAAAIFAATTSAKIRLRRKFWNQQEKYNGL